MAFWKKRKRVVDIRELQKRGVLRIPKDDEVVPTNTEGFVKINKNMQPASVTPTNITSSESSNSDDNVMSFFDNPSTSTTSSEFSSQTNGYNKQEVDEKMQGLDNKIYKLEQRIELLERKAGVSNSDVGEAGW
jgi:hypothetical protein